MEVNLCEYCLTGFTGYQIRLPCVSACPTNPSPWNDVLHSTVIGHAQRRLPATNARDAYEYRCSFVLVHGQSSLPIYDVGIPPPLVFIMLPSRARTFSFSSVHPSQGEVAVLYSAKAARLWITQNKAFWKKQHTHVPSSRLCFYSPFCFVLLCSRTCMFCCACFAIRNKHFNKKIKRAYDKYTVEIRQNLERGTALWCGATMRLLFPFFFLCLQQKQQNREWLKNKASGTMSYCVAPHFLACYCWCVVNVQAAHRQLKSTFSTHPHSAFMVGWKNQVDVPFSGPFGLMRRRHQTSESWVVVT